MNRVTLTMFTLSRDISPALDRRRAARCARSVAVTESREGWRMEGREVPVLPVCPTRRQLGEYRRPGHHTPRVARRRRGRTTWTVT